MASKKKKAAKGAAGAVAAGQAFASNPYVVRLIEDEELRDNLRTAFDSSKKAYGRMSNGKGPAKALLDDKKTQKELREAANSLKEAADSLRGAKKKKRSGRRGILMLVVVGGVAALVLSEGLRKKVLDALFGAEEEFEYTSTTSPTNSSGAATGATAGAASENSFDKNRLERASSGAPFLWAGGRGRRLLISLRRLLMPDVRHFTGVAGAVVLGLCLARLVGRVELADEDDP
jgi:hypothetical protein